jgi:hypothetical protein
MRDTIHKLEGACSKFEADLVLYYYGDIPEAERSRIEDHCRLCSRCARFVEDLHKLLPQIAKPAALPQGFWDDYYRETMRKLATVQESRRSWWREFFAPVHVWMIPAFGTVAVAVLAIGLMLEKGHWDLPLMSSRQDVIPQEILADQNKVEFFESMDLLESLGPLEKMDGSNREGGGVQQL